MILLDSQVLLWVLTDSPALGPVARRSLAGTDSCWVSALTLADLATRSARGRVRVPDDLPALLAEQGLQTLAFESRHVAGLPVEQAPSELSGLLLAQARVDRMAFLTADQRLLEAGPDDLLDARR